MKRRISGVIAGTMAGFMGAAGVAAQTAFRDRFFGGNDTGHIDVASAGNGGVAGASANGGAVAIGDINSGGNAGSAIGVGNTAGGGVSVDAGLNANTTSLDVSANGGTAIANAAGGNYNIAFVS